MHCYIVLLSPMKQKKIKGFWPQKVFCPAVIIIVWSFCSLTTSQMLKNFLECVHTWMCRIYFSRWLATFYLARILSLFQLISTFSFYYSLPIVYFKGACLRCLPFNVWWKDLRTQETPPALSTIWVVVASTFKYRMWIL